MQLEVLPGPLGLTVDIMMEVGGARIKEVKENCAFKDMIAVGDYIITVDDRFVNKSAVLRENAHKRRILRITKHFYRQLKVPSGPLGLTVEIMELGGARIKEVKENCPLKDMIAVGDCIITIDDRFVNESAVLRENADKTRMLRITTSSSITEGQSLPAEAVAVSVSSNPQRTHHHIHHQQQQQPPPPQPSGPPVQEENTGRWRAKEQANACQNGEQVGGIMDGSGAADGVPDSLRP